MSQNDMVIANQTFPATRSDINAALQALASTSSGTTRPSTAYTGQFWIETDNPTGSLWTLYNYDGSSDIPVGIFDASNHRFYPATRMTPGGRVALTSGTPVTTSDVTAATVVYYTPHNHDVVPIYTGNGTFAFQVSELSLALNSNSGHTGYHQIGKNFDLFVFLDGSTLRLGTGPAWSSDTSRGTGGGSAEITKSFGLWVNANTMTIRFGTGSGNTVSVDSGEATYVGTIRCTADGQTEDSLAKRFVWNAFNQVARPMARFESTDSWSYSTSAWRQANNSAANQLDFVIGLPGHAVEAVASSTTTNSDSTLTPVSIAIGLDSASAPATNCILGRDNATNSFAAFGRSHFRDSPGIGRHYLAWLEYGNTAGGDTQTWYGDAGEAITKNGIIGSVSA